MVQSCWHQLFHKSLRGPVSGKATDDSVWLEDSWMVGSRHQSSIINEGGPSGSKPRGLKRSLERVATRAAFRQINSGRWKMGGPNLEVQWPQQRCALFNWTTAKTIKPQRAGLNYKLLGSLRCLDWSTEGLSFCYLGKIHVETQKRSGQLFMSIKWRSLVEHPSFPGQMLLLPFQFLLPQRSFE